MRKLFLMICLLLFSFQLKAETTVETGLLVNNTCAIDTVFFYSQKSGNQFKASYLFVKLDEDAAGNVIIRRGIKRYRSNLNTEIEFLETTDHVLRPGGVFKSEYVGMYCFYFSKTLASDEIIYVASNVPGTEITSSSISISYLASVDSLVEMISDPVELVTTLVGLADTLALSDTLLIDGGDISGYREIYVKFLADTFATDSLSVHFGTGTSSSWDAGNASFFGDTISIGGLSTYGGTYAVTDSDGNFIAGDRLLIMIINWNIGIGETGSESGCTNISDWVLMRK